MRFIRLLFIIALAVILVAVALANREIVTLSLFPANLDRYVQGEWSINLPLFIVIFGAFAIGIVVGLVWEYLREAQLRREARHRSAEVARLEREVGSLRQQHASPRDDVLAIVDGPKPSRNQNSANALPAPR